MKDDNNNVHITFIYSSNITNSVSSYAYLDNVNIYSMKQSVDGVFADANGQDSYLAPITLDGASVRLNTPAGIRFQGRVDKEYIDGLGYVYGTANVKYGVLIAPYDYITGEFTIDALGSGKYLKIEAEKLANEDTAKQDRYYQFNCAMVNIKASNYGRDFAARTYIEISKGDGTTEYIYSDFDEKTNVRSIASVATMALSDPNSQYSNSQKNILNGYCSYSVPLSTGSDVRVMSVNILDEDADGATNALSPSDRADILLQTIGAYAPAIVGLQEVTSGWQKAFQSKTTNEVLKKYTMVGESYTQGTWWWETTVTNETMMLYDSTKVTLGDSAIVKFTANKDVDHTMTWAVFTTVSSNEKFIAINAHLTYDQNKDVKVRDAEWQQLVSQIATLKSTYGNIPIIIFGDFNTAYTDDEYQYAVNANLLDGQDAVLAGNAKGGFTCDTIHDYGVHANDLFEAHGTLGFDHVFIDDSNNTANAKFNFYSVIVNHPVLNMSDHYPIYADIVLNPGQ